MTYRWHYSGNIDSLQGFMYMCVLKNKTKMCLIRDI